MVRDAAPWEPEPAAPSGTDGCEAALRRALSVIEANLEVLHGHLPSVQEAGAAVAEALVVRPDLIGEACMRLAAASAHRRSPCADEVRGLLARLGATAGEPRPAVLALLRGAAGRPGVEAALELVEHRSLPLDGELVGALAEALAAAGDDEALVARLGRLTGGSRARTALERLLVPGSPGPTRRLAARVLDHAGGPPDPTLARTVLGASAHAALQPLLEFTRAGHADLVALTPGPEPGVPARPALDAALSRHGAERLGRLVAALGWERVNQGLSLHPLVVLSVGDGPPFVVDPQVARLLEACGPSRRWLECDVVVAHGRAMEGGEPPAQGGTVRRFRGYNLAHAELLAEILAVVPVTAARARRILELMDHVVTDFAALFAEHDEDAARVAEVYAPMRERVERACAAADGMDRVLPLEVTRELQAFEDPQALYEVRTLHGLKRFLHQHGLRSAFRLFRAGASANRTVDLVLATPGGGMKVVRAIRYIDFEAVSPGQELPWVVQLLVRSFVHQMVRGVTQLPVVEILLFGTEVQVYVRYRNHPAFLRLDVSPPLRGGMLDLEYFAVSQYELGQHPDLELPAIQEVLRRLGCLVEREGFRLHARYDKEQARSLDELVEVASAVFNLLPSLMDLDWTLGDLDYPAPVRRHVAEAWAERFLAWGELPAADLLTVDRRGVLIARQREAGGEREVRWDGEGPYRDRFTSGPPPDLPLRLARVLREHGLPLEVPAASAGALGQRWLERSVLEPLRTALATGELVEHDGALTAGGLEPLHEAVHLARLLRTSGEGLARAAALGASLGALERHLTLLPSGTVNGFPVERATFALEGEAVTLVTLRDGHGVIRLLEAARGRRLLVPKSASRGAPVNLLDPVELMLRLRRANFLPPGASADQPAAGDAEAEVRAFATVNPHALEAPEPGDRVARCVPACPGRAAGLARFDLRPQAAPLLEDAVLVAPGLGPADAPLLRRAAALVTTGGGVLSHLGTVALELGKPATVASGRWERGAGGVTTLWLRRLDYQITEHAEGAYHATCWHGVREHEEPVHEGDLLVVDADAGLVWLLGGDREALELERELRQLRAADRETAAAADEPAALVRRGRLLRTAHSLGRLAGHTRRPGLARYLACELLLGLGQAVQGRDERRQVLGQLLANPACGSAAASAVERLTTMLVSRFEALVGDALEVVPRLESPQEIAYVHLGVARLGAALEGLARLELAACRGADPAAAAARVGQAARRRLEAVRGAAAHPAPGCERWRRRHLSVTAAVAERLLAGSTAPPSWPSRRHRLRRPVTGRVLVRSADGGAELAGEVGAKAANLGELVRVLGAARVPPWFALTDHAFRLALAAAVPEAALPVRSPGGAHGPTLETAIAAVLAHPGDPPAHRAAAIRALWRATPLPSALASALVAAYRGLGSDLEPVMVAVRSSGREEDAESSAWAGQFDTFLYVSGDDALLEHVRLAWAGLWSERAIAQRAALGDRGDGVGGGVIVQRMVAARAAGVLHTVSAATQQVREMVVNVGLGLGEGVVSGVVEVDQVFIDKDVDPGHESLRLRYVVGDKRTRMVFDERRGRGTCLRETLFHQRMRPVLEYGEVCELVDAARGLEAVFRQPLDIEFAWEGRDLYVLQVRPVAVFRRAVEETLARFPLGPDRPNGEEVAS